jgi:N-acetylglutamate synthase-like GNAT family acetyltransferase
MTLEIRRALHADAAKIITAHQRSIREICSKDYPPEQIEAWAGRDFREDRWHQTMDKDFVWVISDLDLNVYGFGHLQIRENAEAEIAGLYFAPEVIGKGFGKKLMAIILDECRNKEVKTILLTATKTAKSFYQSAGFQQVGEARLIGLGGQKIECFDMTMTKF